MIMEAILPVSYYSSTKRSPLSEFFAQIHPVSTDALDYLDRHCFPVNVRKGDFVIQPGSNTRNLYLLLKGVVRGYILESGKEITTWINEENEVIGSIRSLGL